MRELCGWWWVGGEREKGGSGCRREKVPKNSPPSLPPHPQNYFNATNALVAATPALHNKSLAALLTGPARTGAGLKPSEKRR